MIVAVAGAIGTPLGGWMADKFARGLEKKTDIRQVYLRIPLETRVGGSVHCSNCYCFGRLTGTLVKSCFLLLIQINQ